MDMCGHREAAPAVSMTFVITRVCPAFVNKSSRIMTLRAYLRTSKLSKKRRKLVSKLRSCAVADIISIPFRTFIFGL